MDSINPETGDFCIAGELSHEELMDYFSDLHHDVQLATGTNDIEYLKQIKKLTILLLEEISNCLPNE